MRFAIPYLYFWQNDLHQEYAAISNVVDETSDADDEKATYGNSATVLGITPRCTPSLLAVAVLLFFSSIITNVVFGGGGGVSDATCDGVLHAYSKSGLSLPRVHIVHPSILIC